MRGLCIGRFQPFHIGHKEVIEYIAEEVDELIIGIGSSQISHSPHNPFTAGERVLMITRSISHLKIPFYVLPIPDVNCNALWVSQVLSMVPHFDIVYASNPLVLRLFREAGIAVRSPPLFERNQLSGTAIRKLMIADAGWEAFVPRKTAEIIKEIDGIARLQDIAKSDE